MNEAFGNTHVIIITNIVCKHFNHMKPKSHFPTFLMLLPDLQTFFKLCFFSSSPVSVFVSKIVHFSVSYIHLC